MICWRRGQVSDVEALGLGQLTHHLLIRPLRAQWEAAQHVSGHHPNPINLKDFRPCTSAASTRRIDAEKPPSFSADGILRMARKNRPTREVEPLDGKGKLKVFPRLSPPPCHHTIGLSGEM